jgi:hypothetical protein
MIYYIKKIAITQIYSNSLKRPVGFLEREKMTHMRQNKTQKKIGINGKKRLTFIDI